MKKASKALSVIASLFETGTLDRGNVETVLTIELTPVVIDRIRLARQQVQRLHDKFFDAAGLMRLEFTPMDANIKYTADLDLSDYTIGEEEYEITSDPFAYSDKDQGEWLSVDLITFSVGARTLKIMTSGKRTGAIYTTNEIPLTKILEA